MALEGVLALSLRHKGTSFQHFFARAMTVFTGLRVNFEGLQNYTRSDSNAMCLYRKSGLLSLLQSIARFSKNGTGAGNGTDSEILKIRHRHQRQESPGFTGNPKPHSPNVVPGEARKHFQKIRIGTGKGVC